MDTADLQLEHFTALVGETVVGDFGEQGTIDFEVIEAVDRPTGSPKDIAFSILFRGPTDLVFQQGPVALEHPSIGAHTIFLVAISEDETGRVYEAVFTRVLD